jgi:uncharacterized protein YjbI with pentapeptide repeats
MTSELATWKNWTARLETFDLQSIEEADRDIIGKLITGEYSNVRFRRNFQRCAFRNAKLTGLNWQRVDYKDTAFIDTNFLNSNLGGGSTVSCTFSNCCFEHCVFDDAAIHDCQYENCIFIDCTFLHSMIRNSELSDCRLEQCQTSNKLFDGCRIFSNSFRNTKLDFRAVLDNFGFDNRQLPFDLLREDRTFPDDVVFPLDKRIANSDWRSNLSPIEIVKLQYYLTGGELVGNELIDGAFQPNAWVELVRAPINLTRLLQDFSEFILRLYTQDKISAVYVLKLAILADAIWQGFSDQQSNLQISQAGAGVYLNCIRWLETLDSVVASWISNSLSNKVVWRTFDNAADEEIALLAKSLRRSFPDIVLEVRPRNSPVDIVLSGLTNNYVLLLVTLFFCTKTRLELSSLAESTKGKTTQQTRLISFSVGGAENETLRNAISVTSALPGAMILQLNVDYSVALVQKIKKLVKGIIS